MNATVAHEAEGTVDGAGPLVATFYLGEAAFGVHADHVQEVVRTGTVTPVHHAPSYVVGIRNLRGRIVTVIDLGSRLELTRVELGEESRILIMDWKGEPIGLLVDEVADTVSVTRDSIEPAPANVHGVQARNIKGVFRTTERLVALLDLSSVLDVTG